MNINEKLQVAMMKTAQKYLDLQDEIKWNNLFTKTQLQLIAAAEKARKEIKSGLAKPMNYDYL
ncbi:MAG TPA: hypothetical protein VK184_16970 [Nostocaceae cyanobacterium]|nr:hypothetical protein [Nostocaceae cyanobacterium]